MAAANTIVLKKADLPSGFDAQPHAAPQGSFTIPLAGTNVPVYVDFIIFRAGRAEVTLQTTNAGSPFDSKLEQELAKKMADRT